MKRWIDVGQRGPAAPAHRAHKLTRGRWLGDLCARALLDVVCARLCSQLLRHLLVLLQKHAQTPLRYAKSISQRGTSCNLSKSREWTSENSEHPLALPFPAVYTFYPSRKAHKTRCECYIRRMYLADARSTLRLPQLSGGFEHRNFRPCKVADSLLSLENQGGDSSHLSESSVKPSVEIR